MKEFENAKAGNVKLALCVVQGARTFLIPTET